MTYNYNSSTSRYVVELKPKEKDMPLDTVSCIVWDVNKSEPMFATGSWDGFIRLYIVTNNDVNKVWDIFLHHPVLSLDFSADGIIFAGLASGDVVAVELQTSSVVALGNHEAPICGVYWLREKGCLMTLGFDNLIRLWALQQSNAMQMEYKLPLKTVTCSMDFPYLLVGSIETTFFIFNLKNLPQLNLPANAGDYLNSTLDRFSKFVCCRILSSNNTAMMGTIDGRVVFYTFKESTYNNKTEISNNFVTRVQKRTEKNITMFGQVNAIDLGYHNYESFSVIGGTEEISIYNTQKKSKARALASNNSTTGAGTAIKLSPKNEYVAFATGTDWIKGLSELEGIKKPKIGVVKLSNSDLSEFVAK
jgi:WD40 repeat protein